MLIRTVRMTFSPTDVDAFLALFRDARPKIASMPGCRHLELWRDSRYPNVFTTYSHWDDAASLDAYRRSELFTATWARTTPLFAARAIAYSQERVAL